MRIGGSKGGKYSPGAGPTPKTRNAPSPPLQKIRQGKNTRAAIIAPLESRVVMTWLVVTPAIELVEEVETLEKLVIVGRTAIVLDEPVDEDKLAVLVVIGGIDEVDCGLGLVELEPEEVEPLEVELVEVGPVEVPADVVPVDVEPLEVKLLEVPVDVVTVDVVPADTEPLEVELLEVPVGVIPVDVEPVEMDIGGGNTVEFDLEEVEEPGWQADPVPVMTGGRGATIGYGTFAGELIFIHTVRLG
ncbi:MAG: hypothetical protein M1813_005951 [Trichoglossum hirsutum]|nr:MAG: hypothetical protein M1813_005951 [Trichoglossum hirsutum]